MAITRLFSYPLPNPLFVENMLKCTISVTKTYQSKPYQRKWMLTLDRDPGPKKETTVLYGWEEQL